MGKFLNLTTKEKTIAKKCINKKIKDIYYCEATEKYYIYFEDGKQLVVDKIIGFTS